MKKTYFAIYLSGVFGALVSAWITSTTDLSTFLNQVLVKALIGGGLILFILWVLVKLFKIDNS